MRLTQPDFDVRQSPLSVWAMAMKAVSVEEPARLRKALTAAIFGRGGWVLSQTTGDKGAVKMSIEFHREACVEIYGIIIEAGVELGPGATDKFTELCRCTLGHLQDCGPEIASIELEIQTFRAEGDTVVIPGWILKG